MCVCWSQVNVHVKDKTCDPAARDSIHIFSNSGRLFIVVGGHSEELLYVKYQRVFVVIKTTSKRKYNFKRSAVCHSSAL